MRESSILNKLYVYVCYFNKTFKVFKNNSISFKIENIVIEVQKIILETENLSGIEYTQKNFIV